MKRYRTSDVLEAIANSLPKDSVRGVRAKGLAVSLRVAPCNSFRAIAVLWSRSIAIALAAPERGVEEPYDSFAERLAVIAVAEARRLNVPMVDVP